MTNQRILVATESDDLSRQVHAALSPEQRRLTAAARPPEVLPLLEKSEFSVVFLDVDGKPAREFIDAIRDRPSHPAVIAITRRPSVQGAVSAMKSGASDYLVEPGRDAVRQAVDDARFRQDRARALRELSRARDTRASFAAMSSRNAVLQGIFHELAALAPMDAPVLLTGESGTGKDLAARGLHEVGPRSGGAFVVVNCGAVPAWQDLARAVVEIRSGPPTPVATRRAAPTAAGTATAAGGVTVYLDKVETLCPVTQTCLFPLLDEGRFDLLGIPAPEGPPPRARVIASSTSDLRELVATGEIREDFYYRLAVFPIRLPPLRERLEDLSLLVGGFLRDSPLATERGIDHVSARAMELLRQHTWPGNVRELFNVLERAVLRTSTRSLDDVDLPESRARRSSPRARSA